MTKCDVTHILEDEVIFKCVFFSGSGEPSKETNHKPSFMSDDDLRNLITEAAGGFLIVVECDRGQILYVTNTVEEILFISQVA